MSDLSNKKPAVTESLGGAADTRRPGSAEGRSRSRSGRQSAARSWFSSCTCGSGGSPGPTSSGCPRGPTDPPMYMKIPLIANAIVLWVGLPFALWWFFIRPWRAGAANHARRHAAGVDGPDVLPGSVPQLLQHVVHLQHLAVQPGLLVIAHPGLGVTRGTGPPGAPNRC